MPGQVRIQPGSGSTPWVSPDIRVRSQPETNLNQIGGHIEPINGREYYTYVRVTNIGAEPFGKCRCATGGAWALPSFLIDTNPPANGPGGQTVQVANSYATLRDATGVIGQPILNRPTDFWGWSPNGRLFAYVTRNTAQQSWSLLMLATEPYERQDPNTGAITQVKKGDRVWSTGPTSSTAANIIAGSNFGWNAASTCLSIGRPAGGFDSISFVCPFVSAGTTECDYYSDSPLAGSLPNLDFLFSPCGGMLAITPKQNGTVRFVDLYRADTTNAKRDNSSTSVSVTSINRSLSTMANTGRRGIILTGMSDQNIDNSECLLGGSVIVEAQRVFCSTMPNSMPPTAIGNGQSAAAIWPAEALWVELPRHRFTKSNVNTPAEHWCLQARAGDPQIDPAPSFASFSMVDRHCGQRNIVIT